MPAVAPALVSEDDFLALPETTRKLELLDGEVIMAVAPSVLHQDVLGAIYTELRAWSRRQPGPVFVGIAPLDVRFGPDRILQPDAAVFLEAVDRRAQGPIDRVPALVVEVLSPSERVYERVTKRMVYAEAGVAEYWIVHLSGFVERRTGPSLEASEDVSGMLASPLLPGFSVQVAELFPPPDV